MSRAAFHARHIPQIDSLRGIAAISVVIAHFTAIGVGGKELQATGLFQTFLDSRGNFALGNLAVVFFFALSSFLLTYLAKSEFLATGDFSISRFFVRRCLRIWPLYFAAVFVGGMIYSHWPATAGVFGGDRPTWIWLKDHFWIYLGFLSNWTLAFNYVWGHVDPSPPHFRILWSISVEEQFYVLYPFLILLGFRRRRLAPWIAGVVVLSAVFFRLWFSRLRPDLLELSSAGGMYYATLTYGDIFAAGAVAGSLCAGISGTVTRAYKWMGPIWLLLALGLGHIFKGCIWFPYSIQSVLIYTFIGAAFAGFLHWVVSCADEPSMLWLTWKPLIALGKISYGIYVWHILSNAILARTITRWVPQFALGGDWIALHLLLSITSAIAFGAVSYFVIERPFLLLKLKWTTRVA